MQNCFAQASFIFTATLTYAETYAAFRRVSREGLLDKKSIGVLLEKFEGDWEKFVVLDFAAEARNELPKISSKFALRGADLLHLATAKSLIVRGITCTFVCADLPLANAARGLGVGVMVPDARVG